MPWSLRSDRIEYRLPLEKNRALIEEGDETYRDIMLRKPHADARDEDAFRNHRGSKS